MSERKKSHQPRQPFEHLEARISLEQNETIKLSERDRQAFAEALLNPPAPNKTLLKAAKWHARQIGDGL